MNAAEFVALVGMGPSFERALQLDLAEFLSLALATRTCWLPALPLPEGALDPRRQQAESTALMHAALVQVPPEASRVLVVTDVDVFIPALTFVFGRAQLGGRVALLSLARLRPEFHGAPPDLGVLTRRACTEALHEVGHLLGLAHCADKRCAMSFSVNVPNIDAKRPELCVDCRERSGVLQPLRGSSWRS
jgi:archaemetzincin